MIMKDNRKVSVWSHSYFAWIVEVAVLLGKPKVWGENLVENPNLFGCWDDGMTPEQAITEAKANGINLAESK